MGVRGRPVGELAEQIVGDQGALLRRHPGARTERVERAEGSLADGGAVDREHRGDLVVAAPALEHELKYGALVGRQAVKGGHEER